MKWQAADVASSKLRESIEELEEQLNEGAADAIEKVAQVRVLGTQCQEGHCVRSWPWWVRAMIMEQLVHGTPPTAISANIASDAAYLVPWLEIRVPSVDICRKMRRELRIVSETLAALRVALAGKWRQLFSDATSRRQTSLTTLIIGIDGEDGVLVPVILRAAFVTEGETSEQQVADILSKVFERGVRKLERLREVFEELFPGVPHNIPDPSELTIAKLGSGGGISGDNCNGALKTKRLIAEAVQQAVVERCGASWSNLSAVDQAAKLLVLEVCVQQAAHPLIT